MPERAISWKKIVIDPLHCLKIPRKWFGFRRNRHKAAALAALASRCAQSAAGFIAETEPDFLNLTRDLKDLHACATELGRATDQQVVSLRDTIANTRLIGSDGLATILLDGLRSAIKETETELNSVKEICSDLVRLIHLGDQIGLTAIFLNTARYSFRVESARTDATRQSFGAFTEELEPLANRVGAVGKAIAGQAGNARLELERLVQNISKDSDQLRAVTADTGKVIEQTCSKGQELLDSSLVAIEESGKRAREREGFAGEAIYHVQFGDIVRQKVEHIAAALQDVAEHLAAPESMNAAVNGAALAEAGRVLAIQQSQIERVAAEIGSVGQGLESAFAGLGRETEAIAGSLARMGGGEIFKELKKRLLELEALETRGREMRCQSRVSWKRAIDTSREGARQMDQLREINFRMHLQSLNAIIKTEWLGEDGRTLGVLSSHMHRVFQDSTALVEETAHVLEALVAKTGNDADSAAGESATAEDDLAAGLGAGLRSISRVQDGFHRTVEVAQAMGERQASQLAQARRSIGFLQGLGGSMENLGEEIRVLREHLAPFLSRVPDSAADPLLLARRYTMESEREVHRRHSAEPGPEPEPEPGALGAGSELGDNVEFF